MNGSASSPPQQSTLLCPNLTAVSSLPYADCICDDDDDDDIHMLPLDPNPPRG